MSARRGRPFGALFYLPFIAACAAIFFVSAMHRPPIPDELTFRFADKLLHAIAYAGLCAFALGGAAGRRGTSRGHALVVEAWLLSVAYGASDEIHQSFVIGRSATVSDFIADAVGASLTASVFFLVRLAVRRRSVRHADGATRACDRQSV